MVNFRAKRLGQYFLADKKFLDKLIEAADLKNDDVVLEIGAGTGILTLEIAKYVSKVIAIEKDSSFLETWNIKRETYPNVEFIIADALKILPDLCFKLHDSRFKIIGNIPYYITGRLLRILGELENKPSLIILTMQKEVAERICSSPPRMNLLAACIQFWAKPEVVACVPRGAFRPHPEVDSAVIRLIPDNKLEADISEKYFKVVKAGFRQPRKLLINNLWTRGVDIFKNVGSKIKLTGTLRGLGIKENARPQDLGIEEWKNLARKIMGVQLP